MHDLRLAINTNMGSGSGIRLPYHRRWLARAEIDVLLHTRRFEKDAKALELGTVSVACNAKIAEAKVIAVAVGLCNRRS